MKKFGIIALLVGVVLTGFAQRVVSLSPAVTETIFQLGAESALVGRSRVCDFPAQARELPVAGDFGIPDAEAILKLRADLVITNLMVNPVAAKTLERRGVRVWVAPCNRIGDYRELVAELGKTLHCEAAAAREIARIDAATEQWARGRRYPYRVLLLLWEKPIVVAGNDTFCQELLALSGVEAVDFAGKSGYFTPDMEFLLNSDPDWVLTWHDPRELAAHPGLKRLRAVRENRVIRLTDPDIFQRPGPRWIEAVNALRAEWEKRQ